MFTFPPTETPNIGKMQKHPVPPTGNFSEILFPVPHSLSHTLWIHINHHIHYDRATKPEWIFNSSLFDIVLLMKSIRKITSRNRCSMGYFLRASASRAILVFSNDSHIPSIYFLSVRSCTYWWGRWPEWFAIVGSAPFFRSSFTTPISSHNAA